MEELGGRWAPPGDYGRRIVRGFLRDLLVTEVPEREFAARGELDQLEARVSRLEEALERVTEGLQEDDLRRSDPDV